MTTTPTAATPEELAAKLEALDDETMCFDGPATYALIREAAGMVRSLTSDNEQLNATFDLRHNADARAIKQWQEVTGKTMSMPDQADLCVFLMMALDMSQAQIAELTKERDEARERYYAGIQRRHVRFCVMRERAEKAEDMLQVTEAAFRAATDLHDKALAAALERERAMREALSNAARFVRHLAETESDEVIYASACACEAQIDAALQPKEAARG